MTYSVTTNSAISTDMEAGAFRIQSRGRFAAESRVAVPNLFSGGVLAKIAFPK